MKPLEGIWWEMVPSEIRHHAQLRGYDLPGAWGIALSWGAPGDREWKIQGMIGEPGRAILRTFARGPWSSGDDPREAAWQWCRLHLAPTVRAHRAAQTRRRARRVREREEGA